MRVNVSLKSGGVEMASGNEEVPPGAEVVKVEVAYDRGVVKLGVSYLLAAPEASPATPAPAPAPATSSLGLGLDSDPICGFCRKPEDKPSLPVGTRLSCVRCGKNTYDRVPSDRPYVAANDPRQGSV